MLRLRGLRALTAGFLLETWRSKPALFWNLIFPLFFLVGLSYVFGGGEPEQVTRMVPGILTINLIAAAFFSLSLYMVGLRERGVYRRFSVTPVSSSTIIVAHSLTALVNILISAALQLGVAVVWFRCAFHTSALALSTALLLTAFAFIPLGFLVGSVAGDMKSAPAISNLLFFPLAFLSGAAMPLYLMPQWIQRLSTLLPSTYAVEMLRRVLLDRGGLSAIVGAAGILLLTGIVGLGFDTLLFRWESTQPTNRKALLLAIVTLLLIYAVAFASKPKLESSRAPETKGTGAATGTLGNGAKVLRGMTILDGSGGRIERGRIVVQGNRITSVGEDRGSLPKNAPVEDLSGLYLLPGLIDSHIHLGGSAGGSASPDEYMPSRLVRDTQVYLAMGVTTVVSMSDNVEDMERLRSDVAFGTMRAPRILLCGPGFTAQGGHPAKLFSFLPGLADYMTRQVNTPGEAEKAVRQVAGMQVDFIKLYLEQGWYGQSFPVLPEAALRAAIRTAQELGLWSTVHVDNDRHAQLAIEAGARSIEHVPPDLSAETIQLMLAHGTTLTPTLIASRALVGAVTGAKMDDPLVVQWVDPIVLSSLQSPNSWIAAVRKSPEAVAYYSRRYEQQKAALRRAVSAGVPIIAGTDAGNPAAFHGVALIRELELLVEVGGMTPMAAIGSATGVAAQRLGREDIGRIAPGAFADFLIVSSDPSKDIRSLGNVHDVYLGGTRLQREALLTTRPGNWHPLFSFPASGAKDRK